jgi:hypothetical protein
MERVGDSALRDRAFGIGECVTFQCAIRRVPTSNTTKT